MSDEWRPMGMSGADHDALHEGLPAWMRTRFYSWIDSVAEEIRLFFQTDGEILAAEFDERARMTQPLAPRAGSYHLSSVLEDRRNGMLSLQFADYLLMKFGAIGGAADRLEVILSSSGSAWRVGSREGFVGLERRVPVGVQEAADEVMLSAGNAGRLVSDAWHALYGITPNADVAYKKAILAVEAAGGQKVTPKDRVGTLGKMVTAMRDQGWRLPLADDLAHPSSDVLWKMAKAMVAGEQGRHAADGTHTPATDEEAESAVFLAVSLVQFFHAGLAAKP